MSPLGQNYERKIYIYTPFLSKVLVLSKPLWSKVNRLTCFQIKVKGEPIPTFAWLKNGQKVKSINIKSNKQMI